MKSFTLLTFNLLVIVNIFSQPIILKDWAPRPGDQWRQSLTNETPDPGAAGANQNWDFSNVTLQNSGNLYFNFVEPAIGINADCYPTATIGADLVLDGFGSGFAFGYYELDEDGFRALGESSSFGTKTIYSDPQEFKFIGLQYNETVADDYNGETITDFGTVKVGGTTSYTYDGYGTITLPQGEIKSVARIYQVDVSTDSTSAGAVVIVNLDSLISYGYMAPGSLFPIALWQETKTYSETVINGVSTGLTFEEKSTTFSINSDYTDGTTSTSHSKGKQFSTMKIYPTLASQAIYMNAGKAGEILIFTLHGQQVQSHQVVAGPNTLNIGDLSPGQYIVHNFITNEVGRIQKIE